MSEVKADIGPQVSMELYNEELNYSVNEYQNDNDGDISEQSQMLNKIKNDNYDDNSNPFNNAYDDNIGQQMIPVQVNQNINNNSKITSNNVINNNNNNNNGNINQTNVVSNNNNNNNNNNINKNVHCWNVEYYSKYFEIDSDILIKRLKMSLLPFIDQSFFDKDSNEKPELYGWFWIISTLAFVIAAMGNLYKYYETNSKSYQGDITKIATAAIMLYSMGIAVPLIGYCMLIRHKSDNNNANNNNNNPETGGEPELPDLKFIELLCYYGYSFTPFIPACILSVTPLKILDWIVVLIAFIISIWFLFKNVYNNIPSKKRSGPGICFMFIIIAAQLTLTLSLKFYFFNY